MATAEQATGLSRIDYRDVSAVAIGAARRHSALDWSRRIFEQAPHGVRLFLRLGWRFGLLIGLAPQNVPGHVFGWRVVDVPARPDGMTPGAVLASHSRLGLDTRLVIDADGDRLVVRTLIRYEHLGSRVLWTLIAPAHRAITRRLIRSAARRAGA